MCDFIFSLSPVQMALEAPAVMVVEAKNENIGAGINQCIAEMVAARLYNAQRSNIVETLYGVVTTGSIWKFLQLLADTVYVDLTEYYIKEVETIVGILVHMLQSVRQPTGQDFPASIQV